MANLRQCEFYVLRYVPDVVKGEFVNIGVVLLETGEGEFTDLRLTRDWRRVRCIDPGVDIALLEALEQDLRSKLKSRVAEIVNYKAPMSRRDWLLEQIETSWAGTLQMTPATGVLTESPEAEIGVLAGAYLESPARGRQGRGARGRMAIYNAMRGTFEEAGVWALMQKDIAAEKFSAAGRSVQGGLRISAEWRPAYVPRAVAGGASWLGAGECSQGAGLQLHGNKARA